MDHHEATAPLDGPDASELLPLGEAARRLGLSRFTVYGWFRNGILPAERIGRQRYVRLADVERAREAAHAGDVVPLWGQDPTRAGQRMRALREAARRSQGELAAAAGMTHEAISHLEQGKTTPYAASVRRLAAALKVPPERFIDHAPIGLATISSAQAAVRLEVPVGRVLRWLKTGVLAGAMVSGRWRVLEISVTELDRSGQLRGTSRRLDPRYRG